MPRTRSPRSGSAPSSVSFTLAPRTPISTAELQTGRPYGHGSYQRRMLVFGIAATMALVCHGQSFALISRPVDHWCKPPPQFSDLSVEAWKNVGIPLDKEGFSSQCYVYPKPGNDSATVRSVACNAWDYDQAWAYRTARTYWDMVCHRQWMLALADAVYMCGGLILVPLAGYVADMTGRQPVITAAVMAVLFSTLGSCCADTYFVYVVSRFVSSGSVSSVFVIMLIMMYEVTPFKYQASYTTLMVSVGLACADVFVLLIFQLRISWLWLQALVLSPTVLLLSAFCVIDESPLWLITMSRLREAEEVMKRAAKINGVKLEAAQKAVRRVWTELKGREGSHPVISPVGVASTSEFRGRAAVVFLVSFAVMLAYYRLVWEVLDRQDSEVVTVTSVCLGIPSYMALYIAVNVAGRKQILLFMLPLLGGVCGMCGVAVYARPWYVSYVLMIVAKQCAILIMPVNYIFIAELFPTSARCVVLCAAFACSRVGATVASTLRLLKQYRRDDVGFVIVASVVLTSLVCVLKLPETNFGHHEVPNMEQRKDPLFLMQQSLEMRPCINEHENLSRAPKARQ